MAIRGGKGNEWKSAPARLSAYAIRGQLGGRKVLDVPRIQVTRDNETYRHQSQRLTPYPFET